MLLAKQHEKMNPRSCKNKKVNKKKKKINQKVHTSTPATPRMTAPTKVALELTKSTIIGLQPFLNDVTPITQVSATKFSLAQHDFGTSKPQSKGVSFPQHFN